MTNLSIEKSENKISVIIPVYNTEKFLRRCLDSVIKQTYRNLQIICVNDNSPDNSFKILEEYAKKDPRILIVNNEKNLGLFHARIEGIKKSKGDYIAFLDSDDYISFDYYRCLLKKAKETQSDIVFSKIIHENASGDKYIHNHYNYFSIEETNNPFEEYFHQKGQCFMWHTVWNKLYARELFEHALPILEKQRNHLIMTEDFVFSSVLFYFSKKVSSVEYSYHFYYQHSDASTSMTGGYRKYKKNISDLIAAFDFVHNFLLQKNVGSRTLRDFEEWRELYSRFWYDNICNSSLKTIQKQFLINTLKEGLNVKELVHSSPIDNYFYAETTQWDDRYYTLQQYLATSNCEYYSFDIFDTIVLRPLEKPTDIFYFLDKEYHKLFGKLNSFYEIRKTAEASVRSLSDMEEVTIDEIYEYIEKLYLLDAKKLKTIEDKEKQLEVDFSIPRRSILNIYEMLVFQNKKVIFISDMYLDRCTIETILEKNGIKTYHRLYLSSELKKTKDSGKLFEFVIKDLNCDPNSIFHIGDNWSSDIERAKNVGIQTHYYAKPMDVFNNIVPNIPNTDVCSSYSYPSGTWLNKEKSGEFLGVRCALAVCANQLCDNPYSSFKEGTNFNANSQYIGFFPVGMHLLGVTLWIGKELGNRKLHFIGRDGYLFQKAYKEFYKLESDYVELSRKALLPLSVKERNDIMNLGKYISWDNSTPSSICKLLEPVLKDNSQSEKDEPFDSIEEYQVFLKKVANKYYNEEKCKNYRNIMAAYFYKIFSPNSVLFDIGYSGRSQIILSRLLGYSFDGLFVHINNDENRLTQKELGIDIKSFYGFTPSITGGAREYIFSKQTGSLIGFEIRDNNVNLVHEDLSFNYADEYCISEIQKNAIKFIKEYGSYFKNYIDLITARNIDWSIPFETLMHNSYGDLRVFDCCCFEDELYDGRKQIVLSDIWERDMRYHKLTGATEKAVKQNYFIGEDDTIIRGFKKNKRWKKALCYFLFDRQLFKKKIKEWWNKK